MNWLIELIEMGTLYQFYHEHDFTGRNIVKFGKALHAGMLFLAVEEFMGGEK